MHGGPLPPSNSHITNNRIVLRRIPSYPEQRIPRNSVDSNLFTRSPRLIYHAVMKLSVAVSALVASSRAGVSLAQTMSDGDMTTSSAVTFSDISDRLGPFVNGPTNVNEGIGQSSGLQGMVFFDYDNDDDLDLFVCAESPVTAALFANNGDGTFQDVTDSVGLSGISDCQGVTVGDLDNDGFPELFVTGDLSRNGAFLFRNVDGTSFEDISASSGVVSVPYNWYVSITDLSL